MEREFTDRVIPAWQRVTEGESRVPATLAVIAIMVLQFLLPARLSIGARWLLPTLEGLLLAGIVVANPKRMIRQSRRLRLASIILIALTTAANAWSAGHLVRGLIRGTLGAEPEPLLLTGMSIWLTNVIVFALWYWEMDRGGPSARAHALKPYPDLLFPQMQSPGLAKPDWKPEFIDYMYVSFTNATAFSPTDVMPLSRWAKLTMGVQSAISLIVVALVVARAVNILK